VYRRSAAPRGCVSIAVGQRHGALAKSVEARIFVVDKLCGADELRPLDTRPIAADFPTLATPGEPVTVTVSDAEAIAADADPIRATRIPTVTRGSASPLSHWRLTWRANVIDQWRNPEAIKIAQSDDDRMVPPLRCRCVQPTPISHGSHLSSPGTDDTGPAHASPPDHEHYERVGYELISSRSSRPLSALAPRARIPSSMRIDPI
jgi:hypothetical protein